MKRFEDLSYEESKEVARLFSVWLCKYTDSVIMAVMAKRNEILANDFAMNLLKELAEREAKESRDFEDSIRSLFHDFDTFSKYDPHNHPLEHSGSYRDILYDMYIRDTHKEDK